MRRLLVLVFFWAAGPLAVWAEGPVPVVKWDQFGRFIDVSSKIQVPCPPQTSSTGVLLGIGQSNIANFGEALFLTRYHERVVNYFGGKCYMASSPLLGSHGDGGEFLTPLADALIKLGVYQNVVLVSSAIGGMPVRYWQKDEPLNSMLVTVIKNLPYRVTDVLWHQGESDFLGSTPKESYQDSFLSLVSSLQESQVVAPIFIGIASYCLPQEETHWVKNNPVAEAQRELIDHRNIYLGADTDALLSEADRQSDECHLAGSGQLKAAHAYAQAIASYHSR